jgi:hypothetical protein
MEEPYAMTRTYGSGRGPCNCAWAYSIFRKDSTPIFAHAKQYVYNEIH